LPKFSIIKGGKRKKRSLEDERRGRRKRERSTRTGNKTVDRVNRDLGRKSAKVRRFDRSTGRSMRRKRR